LILKIKNKIIKQTKKQGKTFYQCEECKLVYKSKEWAKKCEDWCKENKSCNIEIIKHAVKMKGG
jgi:hypothetical protein